MTTLPQKQIAIWSPRGDARCLEAIWGMETLTVIDGPIIEEGSIAGVAVEGALFACRVKSVKRIVGDALGNRQVAYLEALPILSTAPVSQAPKTPPNLVISNATFTTGDGSSSVVALGSSVQVENRLPAISLDEIRTAISQANLHSDEIKRIEALVDEFDGHKDRRSASASYFALMAVLADHLQVLTPFLPQLPGWIEQLDKISQSLPI